MVFFKCPSFFRPVFQGKVLGQKALLVWESKFSKSSSFDNEAALTRVVAGGHSWTSHWCWRGWSKM